MIPASFEYDRATSVDDALAKVAAGGKILAGGHSLLPLLKLRVASADRLIDIAGLDELRGMGYLPDGSAEVGPLTTYSEILEGTRLPRVPVEELQAVVQRNALQVLGLE